MIRRPVFINVPGGSYVETYPVLETQALIGGLERVDIKVSAAVFEYIGHYYKAPHKISRLLADIYPLDPIPDPRDIFQVKVRPKEEIISYTIKRGHYLLASFYATHRDPCFTVQHLTCSCHPGEQFILFPTSIPNYGTEDVQEMLKTLHATQAEGGRITLPPTRQRGLRR